MIENNSDRESRAAVKIVAASLEASDAFKIVVCLQVHFHFIWLSLPEKLTIIEIYKPLIWHVAASRSLRSIDLDTCLYASRYDLERNPSL